MSRYGMVVDLNRCIGCQTCTIACKHANDTRLPVFSGARCWI